ncbi:ATP dependent DNA ligase domain-containing protein [Phyllosticta capitalensis]
MAGDAIMQDRAAADEEEMMYGHGALSEAELYEKYPNRPHNHSKTLPFHELYLTLFNPLNDNKKKPGSAAAKKRPYGPSNPAPHEVRANIIDRFISKWRSQVGNDIYPAFRLIVPEKDRDRAMYGLKEKAIGKLLVRVLQINKDSEDGFNLLNWKLPGLKATAAMAGDFAGRCYEVILKRPIRTKPGDMTIAEVNAKLDKLSVVSKEDDQLPIFREFYQRMNAEEMMWLIRIILRQMKVGATEKTLFNNWHPDAESLFNVSSSLRRVCWELYDPSVRLDGEERGINLMQCFQPQLAAFQMRSFEQMVRRMKPTENDDEFWIEEKLDGERMQLHMMEDESVPGGKRFAFWSRKAKDYTYLYGSGFEDEKSALTRYLKDAFDERVDNIVLDGEMITWNMEQDAMAPFGTLKTAALSEQQNRFGATTRPLFKVFDCLYINNQAITQYTLRDRRNVLETSVKSINRRLEIHPHKKARSPSEIEPLLRQVVAEASEGLVLKNPRSAYRLNERNDDWIKVKPEYMTEFGEALDCVIIGGYYGSGHRGGNLSSFMCGLRVDQTQIDQGANPMKCYSFFKVGGGMTADDYANIRHYTGDKWQKWDPKRPPTEFIELGGGDKQYERPDVWIKPDESVVVSVKAASVTGTDQFRMGLTLRFPRFKALRKDKRWDQALSISEFMQLKISAETEHAEKAFKVDDPRKRGSRTKKKKIVVAGQDGEEPTAYAGPQTKVFDGMTFYIMTGLESEKPKKTKVELEDLVKSNGGTIIQTAHPSNAPSPNAPPIICIADKLLVSVAGLRKKNTHSIIRPSWLLSCVAQAQADLPRAPVLLPFEPAHVLHAAPNCASTAPDVLASAVDDYGDSFARDISGVPEIRALLDAMPAQHSARDGPAATERFLRQLAEHSDEDEEGGAAAELLDLPGFMFRGCVVFFDHTDPSAPSPTRLVLAENIVRFAGGRVVSRMDGDGDGGPVSHVVVGADVEEADAGAVGAVGAAENERRSARAQLLRSRIAASMTTAQSQRVPRVVSVEWIEASWKEQTRLDEERFGVL